MMTNQIFTLMQRRSLMIFGLNCSAEAGKVLREFFNPNNMFEDENAGVYLIEAGYEQREDRINIIFHRKRITQLLDFLREIAVQIKENKPFILGKDKNKSVKMVMLHDVLYIEALGNLITCHTVGDQLTLSEKLYIIEERLLRYGFIRVSKSYIVNVLKIESIIPWFNSRMILRMADQSQIYVTRSYLNSFRQYINN